MCCALLPLCRYVYSFYWAIVTFDTLGYGDLHPYDFAEVVFVIFFVSINLVMWAYILGSITLLVTKGDEDTGRYREKMQSLLQYCRTNRLPHVSLTIDSAASCALLMCFYSSDMTNYVQSKSTLEIDCNFYQLSDSRVKLLGSTRESSYTKENPKKTLIFQVFIYFFIYLFSKCFLQRISFAKHNLTHTCDTNYYRISIEKSERTHFQGLGRSCFFCCLRQP
jgi:hypothetical protein